MMTYPQFRFPRLPRFGSPRLWIWVVGTFGTVMLGLITFAAVAGFFDSDPVHLFGLNGKPTRVVAVYFSGDMGLKVGMGTHVAPAMAAHGVPVYGISSPAVFRLQRNQADVDAMVANAVRQALARSGADQVILMGQSFGSDILATALPNLPQDLRARIISVVLVVPAQTVYFRADPTGLRYHGTPDADAVAALKQARWAPVTCIYGQLETDSLCPTLIGSGARVIEMPGGHFLRNDHDKLIATIFTALAPVLGGQQGR